MTRIDEPIALLEKRYNYQPRAFLWRGRRHAIYDIVARWAATGKFWRPSERTYWRVRCQDGALYDIYQDGIANTWHLEAIRPATSH
jgi:hypothetical protein